MPGKPITDQQARLYMDLIETHEKQTAAAKAGFSVATGRRLHRDPRPPSQKKAPRSWRTRADPLAEVWDSEIVPLLERAPGLKAVTVLHELERRFPGRFGEKVRRTLERRVTQWKRFHGPEKEVMFPQTAAPGDVGQSDFTHCDDLGVTIAGAALPHLLYHFALPFSGFEHGAPILSGESFTALAEGLTEALMLLGGAPKTHRTDSLSAAFRNLCADAATDQTRRYEDLCAHYRMTPTRNNRGQAHENGSIAALSAHAGINRAPSSICKGRADLKLPYAQLVLPSALPRPFPIGPDRFCPAHPWEMPMAARGPQSGNLANIDIGARVRARRSPTLSVLPSSSSRSTRPARTGCRRRA